MDYVDMLDELFSRILSESKNNSIEYKNTLESIKTDILSLFANRNKRLVSIFKELEQIPLS